MENIKTGWDLKKFRIECMMTQSEFAKAIGYKLNRISFVERNNHPIHFNMKQAILKHYKNLRRKK